MLAPREMADPYASIPNPDRARCIVRRALMSSALCCVLAACGSAPRVLAVSYDEDGREPTADEIALVSRIAAQVESLRELRFERPIRVGVISEAAVIARARSRAEVRARMPQSDVPSRRTALGLRSERTEEHEDSAVRSGVVSYFNDRCACIRLIEEPLARAMTSASIGAESHIAHELTHALAAQHFPRTLREWASRNNDAQRAIRMVREGDAELVQALYVARTRDVDPERTVDRVLSANFAQLASRASFRYRSAFIRQERHGNYYFGLAFVRAVWEREGWSGVNALHRTPPESTEQVLHPELYFARHSPLHVGAPRSQTLEDAGYVSRGERTLGELETSVWLGRLTDDFEVQAAAGWGGDNSTVYLAPNGESASLWLSKWDTEEDAIEAAQAAERVLARSEHPETSAVKRVALSVLVVQGVPAELQLQVAADVLGR